MSNSRETRLSTIDFCRVPETPSQGEIADPRQKDVLQVDYSTQLEFSNYRIASWDLLSIPREPFALGARDLQDSHTPINKGLVLEPTLFMEFSKHMFCMNSITEALGPAFCVTMD